MTRHQSGVICLAATVLALLVGVQDLDAGRFRRVLGRHAHSEHVMAFAALEPIGESSGWGRSVVRDERSPSGLDRSLEVWLYGLEACSRYDIMVDGVVAGVVETDSHGQAVFQVTTSGAKSGPFPDELPTAAELTDVTILDDSLAAVLEGSFTIVRQRLADAVYREKIEWDDVTGGDARGVAAVVANEYGQQVFTTCATGLQPGSTYRIVVDGIALALVTADSEGQAAVERAASAADDPLPEHLLPVSDIRLV